MATECREAIGEFVSNQHTVWAYTNMSKSTPSTHRKHRYNRHKPRKEKEKENPKESKKWWGLLPLFLGAVNILAEPEGGWGKVAKKKTEVERSFEPRLERKRDRSYR